MLHVLQAIRGKPLEPVLEWLTNNYYGQFKLNVHPYLGGQQLQGPNGLCILNSSLIRKNYSLFITETSGELYRAETLEEVLSLLKQHYKG